MLRHGRVRISEFLSWNDIFLMVFCTSLSSKDGLTLTTFVQHIQSSEKVEKHMQILRL